MVVEGKRTEEIIPHAEAHQQQSPSSKSGGAKSSGQDPIKGAVYLENDRRERKATGSYYTPDYIVKYIVEHTVGPVLKEKLESLRPISGRPTRRSAKRVKNVQEHRQQTKYHDPERETYKHYRKTLNEAFFDLKVLDPAMGSGHFLVEAVDYITDRMAECLTAFRWNPIVYEMGQTRREIQEEMEHQGVTIDMTS